MKCRLSVAIAGLVCGLTAQGRAEDAKKDSVTVLPWSQAAVLFTSGDKSASVEYTQLFGEEGLFYGKASAPLDEDTRIAAFTSNNALAKGFSGSFRIGRDDRAKDLATLTATLKAALAARSVLTSGAEGQRVPYPQYLAFAERHANETPNHAASTFADSTELKKYVCRLDPNVPWRTAPCGDVEHARAICARLGGDCTSKSDAAVGDHAATIAKLIAESVECRLLPRHPGNGLLDRCFYANWYIGTHQLAISSTILTNVTLDDTATAPLWKALELADAETYKKLHTADKQLRMQAFVDNLSTFADALNKLRIMQRDLLLTAIVPHADSGRHSFAVGGDIAYDMLSVHQDDVAAKATKEKKYEWSLGLDYTYYAKHPGLAFSARSSIGRSRDPDAKKTELCTMYPSGDPAVTGKNCDANALFRKGDEPDAKTTAALRGAVTYQYGVAKSADEIVPGVELRGSWERTGSDDAVTGRITLFGTPVKGSVAARVGIALDVAYLINIGDADSRWNVTPLIFIGASFSQLMSSSL